MIYLQLFFAFLQVGALSFGGGYAAMPLIQAQVIFKYNWITSSQFADLVTISEMTPGPIAINAATFVGNQVGGIAGAFFATLGVILPSCLLATLLAWLYTKYRKLDIIQGILKSLRPAVVSLIFAAGLSILIPVIFKDSVISLAHGIIQYRGVLLFAGSLLLLRTKKLNPILVMLGCGVVELIISSVLRYA